MVAAAAGEPAFVPAAVGALGLNRKRPHGNRTVFWKFGEMVRLCSRNEERLNITFEGSFFYFL